LHKKIAIVAASRTAMGSFQGNLSNLSAPQFGAVAMKETVQRAGINTETIDEVIMGCVLPTGLKQKPARQAMRLSGILDHVGATTINKICGSGMKAVMQATDAIKAKSANLIITGCMESMSNAPYLMHKARASFVWVMAKN
jgi:acetyl-CoA C-acetyltransferase